MSQLTTSRALGDSPQDLNASTIAPSIGNIRYGGAYHGRCDAGGSGCGVVIKITPKGQENVLYSFCAFSNCADGPQPQAGLDFGQKGNLYGTTVAGGAYDQCSYDGSGCGVVFKLTP